MESRKKIVILMLHLQHGGIERQTILFANELVKKYDVEIVSVYSMKKEPAYEIDSNIEVKYLMDDYPNKNEFREAVSKRNVFGILKEGIKSFKILYLKKHLMIKEIKKLKCDFVLSTRIEYAEMLSKYCPKGIVSMTQEHLHDGSEKYVNRLKNAISNLDYLVALSSCSEENYRKWFGDNGKTKIVVIPNFAMKECENKSKLDGNTLISTGRLHPVKGFDDLLRVFKLVLEKVPDATLNLLGDGDEKEKLLNMIKEMGLENSVNMPGMVSSEEVKNYMSLSDVYVMTSLTECFPMVLLEASDCGLPLVSFDVPVGPKAIITDGENGYLISDRNIDLMAEKIVLLLSDRKLMKEMAGNAEKNIEQYLPENVMKKWYDIFDK